VRRRRAAGLGARCLRQCAELRLSPHLRRQHGWAVRRGGLVPPLAPGQKNPSASLDAVACLAQAVSATIRRWLAGRRGEPQRSRAALISGPGYRVTRNDGHDLAGVPGPRYRSAHGPFRDGFCGINP